MNVKRRILKAVVTFVVAVMADVACDVPVAHAAEPPSITKTQSFMESAGADSIQWPAAITNEEGVWKLVDVSDPSVDPNWTRPAQMKSVTKSITVEAAQAHTANSLFGNTVSYDQSGWTGTLTKAGVTLSPEYEVCERQVDKLVTLEGLTSNDVTLLPQTKEFEVTTAETLTSTGTAALALSDVAWVVTETDGHGVPVEYSASCNYRGIEEYLTIPAYTLTCTWTGEVLQSDSQMLSTATYELDETFPWVVLAGVTLSASILAIGLYFRAHGLGSIVSRGA